MKSKLPGGWKKVKVSDLGKVITGKTPKTKDVENYNGKTPFLTPSDDMESRFVKYTSRTLSETGVKTVKNQVIPKNSICVSCIGSQLGKVVITNEDTVTNQQINSIVVGQNIEYMYVYYVMLLLGDRLRYISKTSTAVPIINKTNFSKEELALPSLKEQKVIADTLSSLDSKIELNKKINKNLEEQAQAIFKHWFIDFEFPDENGNPYKSSGGEMVESELGMIPKGWKVKMIKHLCQITSSKRIFRKDYSEIGIPFLRGKEIIEKSKGNQISTELFITTEQYNEIKEKFSVPNEKDILLTSVGTLGVSYQVGQEEFYFKDGNITWFKDFKKCEFRNYVYIFLNSDFGQQELNKIAIGSTQKALTISALKEIPIISPDSILLGRFDTTINSILDKMNNSNLQNQKLSQLRDTLLPKLMSGEIRIPLD